MSNINRLSHYEPADGAVRLPPANWKAELRVSKEQTKRKRRRKRRGILDRLMRTFLILFGLAAEV